MKATSINEEIKDLERQIAHKKALAELEQVRSDPIADPVISALRSIKKAMTSTEDPSKTAGLKTASDALFSVLSLPPDGPLANTIINPGDAEGDGGSAPDGALIRRFLNEHPGRRCEEIAEGLSTTTAAVQKGMKSLVSLGDVQKQGKGPGTQYFLRAEADRPPETL